MTLTKKKLTIALSIVFFSINAFALILIVIKKLVYIIYRRKNHSFKTYKKISQLF